MRGARLIILPLAAILTLAIVPARAADYSPPPPPPCYDIGLIQTGRAPPGAVPCYVPPPPPPPIEFAAAWYLRGDIGFSQQQVKRLDNVLSVPGTFTTPNGYGFDSAGIFGLGVGYYFNDWLRFDLTGEYRGRSNFHGLEIFNGGAYTDEYHGSKSEWLFLANGYIDLGTWGGFTPFVGAGVGTARVTIHNFVDNKIPNLGVAYANNASKWNFAWAAHAGIAYKISKSVYAEFSYRYLWLGDGVTGDIITYNGINNVNNPTTFKGLTSHDFRVGLRFNLDCFCDYRAPPVVYQPPPQYYPPPQPYYPPPPPLRSKG